MKMRWNKSLGISDLHHSDKRYWIAFLVSLEWFICPQGELFTSAICNPRWNFSHFSDRYEFFIWIKKKLKGTEPHLTSINMNPERFQRKRFLIYVHFTVWLMNLGLFFFTFLKTSFLNLPTRPPIFSLMQSRLFPPRKQVSCNTHSVGLTAAAFYPQVSADFYLFIGLFGRDIVH